MKKIILALLFATTLISCTQNEGTDTSVDSKVLIVGKWDLISDTYGTANNPAEMITTCKEAFWQFDFKNNKDMVFRSTSDDPSLGISQCDPKLLDYTYSINNEVLTMTPVNTGYSTLGGFIESVSSTRLVIRFGIDANQKFRKFTFKRQVN